ncbi:2-dehydropantoate 2-reductase [Ideonella margarita]|uniref:2-dehydropantoate 2-reductase n=1 Tax=Ideonella margarita TaxID=2984191 RepID=A0ABU9C363_9BURK
MNDSSRPSILVMGTGSVGGFVGGGLAAAGADLSFVARPRMLGALRQHGLHLTDLDGRDTRLAPSVLQLHTHIPEGLQPALVLLCVKSGATAEAAGELARMLPAGTPVLSLQNGIGNAALGARVAPELVWLPGMVPYNIAELGPGRLHRGTAGQLAAQRHLVLEALVPTFEQAGLPLRLHDDLAPVQWAKLLMNLNNPVNALSGLPLRAQLLDRGYRRVLAALQQEALGVLAAAGIEPAQLGPVPPARMPALLRLPTAVFRLLAARMLRIDDKARSSMADDVALGKPTEIDAICGAVVELAQSKGGQAPLAAGITTLVKGLGSGAPVQSSRELLRALGLT